MKGAIMGIISDFRYRKISQTSTVEDLLKEFFRKSIHICASFVPLFAAWNLPYTVMALSSVVALYIISEYLRISGISIPVISRVTAYAARRRDEGRFILGPVTLTLGIVITLMIFPQEAARVGICALAFGDGIASLAGKLFGRIKIPYTCGKTLEGSLACFIAVYASSLAIVRDPLSALLLAFVAMCIEMIPLKDYDNVLIPIAIAAVAYLLP
jgi:dolichol kinase